MNPDISKFEWTPVTINRFWERFESTEGTELLHFANQRGKALLRYVSHYTTLSEPVLDLGCGSGHLLELCVNRGLRSYGADTNPKAVEVSTKRLSSSPLLLGTRLIEDGASLPFDDKTISTVFLLETIEHLLPPLIEGFFAEIVRILRPRGLLVITTPYREDLRRNTVVCKQCNTSFHRVQHLQSFDVTSVNTIVRQAGLTPLSCRGALLLPDWTVWLRAQTAPCRTRVVCPQCSSECPIPNRSTLRRWRSLVHELRHLVCIANKP